ncbi:MAG: hypothetical protein ABFR82_11800 [Nitrospirota bacterium]
MKDMANHIDFYLAEHQRSVETLAGINEIRNALVNGDETSMAKANAILDHFKDTLELSVCYIMDAAGNTIASSNRKSPVSFLGKNYSFRPYFKKALKGNASCLHGPGRNIKEERGLFRVSNIWRER